jgi:hypothetical protein
MKLSAENGDHYSKAVQNLRPLVHEAETKAVCYTEFQVQGARIMNDTCSSCFQEHRSNYKL